ncbi:MAG: ATP-binding protein, partial [Caulobacteraceae bacterium]
AQLDLVLLNLGLNGRDAMPNGGVLTLCARNVALNGEMEGLTGQFVAITVRDTGIGIASEDLARVFEPFFTTKPLGEGTGLGLSQAYGFARQSNGAIKVESAEGEGTSVTLYLPARPMSEVTVAPDPVTEESGRTGRVLVVEDDTAVSELAAELVREAGYEVVVAANADQGLKVLTANGVGFDLVFSDIMMPGEMNGLEFARAVRERFPALPILLTTGYSEAASAGPSEFPLLTKPYQLSDLLAAFERVRAETGRKSA